MLLAGQQIAHYRLLRLIGSGGMGEVYLAADMAVERQVAIKVTRTDISLYSTQEEFREAVRLFNREANAIARLDHSHILPLFECGEEPLNGTTFTYLVMPYRPEGSLADLFRQRKHPKQFPPQDVAHIVLQAADALQHAHIHQIIHRDVKPSNFLLRYQNGDSERPDLLLTDFGIAKLSTTSDANTSTTIRGTATYMAPEQWEDHPVPQTDQYALAVMAYELLTGHPPFLGNQQQLMYQHFQVQPKPPSNVNPHISKDIDAALLRALAKNPADRFPSISAFAHAFQEAILESNNIRLTLTISQLEALTGTMRTLLFPDGRQVTVSVPAGVTEGQVIRLEGQGRPAQYPGDLPGALILTVSIIYVEEEIVSLANSQTIESTVPVINPDNLDSNNDVKIIKPERKRIRAKSILLIALVLIVIAGGFGLYYGTNSRQKEIEQANATGTAQAHNTAVASSATGTAQANATSTSQANATATTQASANATATAQANLYATATAQANIYATATARANATAVVRSANPNPYPPYGGTLVLYDPLRDNSQGNSWDDWAGCAFTSGAYHVIQSQKNYFNYCIAENTNFSNFVYEAQMTIISGDCGALIFRADGPNDKYYYFRICQDGTYDLIRYDTPNSPGQILKGDSSSAITTGYNQSNLIAIVAIGSNIDLYANHQKITSVSDSTYSMGQIGVVADAANNSTEVIYNNVKVWEW